MHRYPVFLTILFSLHAAGFMFGQGMDHNALLVEVMENYQKLIAEKPDGKGDENITSAWMLVSRAIQEGHLRFTIDPDSKGLLTGARFNALPGEKVAHVIISKDLFRYWADHPSTVYAIIAAAFQEAAVFFLDPPAWGALRWDIMEQLLLKVDIYAAQAEIIQRWLLPRGYLLSSYDTYILDSYEQDGLASVLLFLDRFSLPVLQGLYQMRLAYEENNDSDALRTTVLEFGERLLSSRAEVSDNDDAVFPLAVALHSWLEFTPELIARIHNKDRTENPLTFEQILGREKSYSNLRQRLENSRIADYPIIERIAKEIEENFGRSPS